VTPIRVDDWSLMRQLGEYILPYSRLDIQYLWGSQLDILCNVFADYHAPHWWFYNCGGSFQDEH
jgi:hypothetical protein